LKKFNLRCRKCNGSRIYITHKRTNYGEDGHDDTYYLTCATCGTGEEITDYPMQPEPSLDPVAMTVYAMEGVQKYLDKVNTECRTAYTARMEPPPTSTPVKGLLRIGGNYDSGVWSLTLVLEDS